MVEVFGEWERGGLGGCLGRRRHAASLSKGPAADQRRETAFCYTDDAAPLLAHLAPPPAWGRPAPPAPAGQPGRRLPLKLTGRAPLRD